MAVEVLTDEKTLFTILREMQFVVLSLSVICLKLRVLKRQKDDFDIVFDEDVLPALRYYDAVC